MSDTVLYEADGPIATVTLNRPENMNTMNIELLAAAVEILERVASDDAIRAVIFTGNGRAFCAGGDLGGGAGGGVFDDRPVQQQVESLRRAMRTSQLLHDMPKVTIAAINGACAGAGLSWACACDIRYAAESAKFNTAFLSAGVSGRFRRNLDAAADRRPGESTRTVHALGTLHGRRCGATGSRDPCAAK